MNIMGLEKLMLGLSVFGILALGSCKQEINTPSDITLDVKHTGTIKGRVVWDPNKDGVYNPVSADVCLDKPIYLMPTYKTSSNSLGLFSFQEISTGTYEVWVTKITYDPTYTYWRTKVGAIVTKQEIVNLGDIKLEVHEGGGY